MGKNKELTEEELAFITMQQQAIAETIQYCRQKERQVKGFGLACLDDLSKDGQMSAELKEQIKTFIENPALEFKVKFKPH